MYVRLQATQEGMDVYRAPGNHARVRTNRCVMMTGHVSCRNPVLRERGEEVADGDFPDDG